MMHSAGSRKEQGGSRVCYMVFTAPCNTGINIITIEADMSMRQIVTLADSVVKGQRTRIPPMKGAEWREFCWWIDFLRGYAM